MCYAREGSNPSGVVFLFFTRLGVIYTHVGNKKIVTRVHSSVAEHRIANPGVAGAIPAAPSFSFHFGQIISKNKIFFCGTDGCLKSWSYSVMAITEDSESSNSGSSPDRTFSNFFGPCPQKLRSIFTLFIF